MKPEETEIGMMVEWSFGGLADIRDAPFKKYGEWYVHIRPFNTGDPSTGVGMLRRWPVAQLEPADMDRWSYDASANRWNKRR